jgi:subtilisin family serine protease
MSSPLVRTLGLCAGLALVACQDPMVPVAPAAAPAAAVVGASVPDAGVRWVVRLRDGGDAERVLGARVAVARRESARSLAAGRMRGFVAALSDDEVRALRADAGVASVEPDREIRGAGVQLDAPWGLDRIDQAERPLAGTYVYPVGGGAAVTVYVLDTGIRLSHAEFGGRAVAGADFVNAGSDGAASDCNGHGTHDAAVVGGRTYGVAKSATIVSVRVLDCALKGTMSQAIAALGWVVEQRKAHPGVPAVVNLSLEGTSGSDAFDQAVKEALAAGVTVVAAAGNSSTDACSTSPARVPGVITVGATDNTDAYAAYSNRGACLALAAPGSNIVSAWATGDSASRMASGTSSAAPFVAGAAALYLAAHPTATPVHVRAALVENASRGALSGVPAGTPNLLLGVGFLLSDKGTSTPNGLTGPRVERWQRGTSQD